MNAGEIRRALKALYPVENLVLLFFGMAWLLYTLLGLSFRDPFRLYISKVLLGLVSYLLGHLLAILLVRLRDIREALAKKQSKHWRASVDEYKKSYFSAGKLSHDLRLLHAVSAMFVVYINLKHLIPYVNSRLYDETLMNLERWLFSGKSPGMLVVESIGLRWAPLLSDAYTAFYPYVAFLTVFLLLRGSLSYAQKFSFAFCLLWFLAIFVEYAFPTLGPCFFYPELFSHLPHTRVTELQQELWQQKLYLDLHPQSDKGVWLISGLPSLHIAAVFLGTLYLRKLNRFAAYCSWLLLLITCVTTMYFGWHYLADLPSAFLLVVFVQYLSTLVFEKTATSPRELP